MGKEKLYAFYNKETKEYLKREWPYDNLPEINYRKEYFEDKISDGFEIIEWVPRNPFYTIKEQPFTFSVEGTASIYTQIINIFEYKNSEDEEPSSVNKDFLVCCLSSGNMYFTECSKTEEGYESTFVSIQEDIDDFNQPCWTITVDSTSRDCDGLMESKYIYKSKGGHGRDPALATKEYIEKYGLDENMDVKRSRYKVEYYNSPSINVSEENRDIEAERAGY